MVVGRLLSHWEGNFSGAMLNFPGGIPTNPSNKNKRQPVGSLFPSKVEVKASVISMEKAVV